VSKRILVIEDEPDVIDLLERVLQKSGFVTVVATDGEAGIKTARDQQPAVIILDLRTALRLK